MSLSQAQKQAVEKWLKEHNAAGPCEACGSQAGVAVHESLITTLQLEQSAGNKFKATPSGAAMILTACKNCACIRLFAAKPILGA